MEQSQQQGAKCMLCGYVTKRVNSMWTHLKAKHGEPGMRKGQNWHLTDEQPTRPKYGHSRTTRGVGRPKIPKVLGTGKGELSYVEVPVVLRIPVAFGGISVVEQP